MRLHWLLCCTIHRCSLSNVIAIKWLNFAIYGASVLPDHALVEEANMVAYCALTSSLDIMPIVASLTITKMIAQFHIATLGKKENIWEKVLPRQCLYWDTYYSGAILYLDISTSNSTFYNELRLNKTMDWPICTEITLIVLPMHQAQCPNLNNGWTRKFLA